MNILSKGKLLDEKGELIEKGYAKSLVREYCRADIKAKKSRIKEWDYYIITNGRFAVALTIDDNSYMSLASASFLDFEKPEYQTTSVMHFFSNGKVGFPSTCEKGNVNYKDKRVNFSFEKDGSTRVLKCDFQRFKGEQPLSCCLTLTKPPKEYMVIATPFAEDKKAFYYNCKINCMTAEGYVSIGSDKYVFDNADSLGTLDWGRGVWTRKNTWFWGSMQTRLSDGKTFGWNVGYGFGDTTAASEDMLFYDGAAHKLGRTQFHIPTDENGQDDFMSPWTFTSDDNRFEMTFKPIIDRKDVTDVGIICSKQHQVFGIFNGKAILDDGTEIEVKDKLGFAEKVYNKW